MFTLGLEDAYSALLWSLMINPADAHPTHSHALLRDLDSKQLIVGGDWCQLQYDASFRETLSPLASSRLHHSIVNGDGRCTFPSQLWMKSMK